MSALCNSVQEAMSWTRTLDQPSADHIQACDGCRVFLEQISLLDIVMTQTADVHVPDGFADGVMTHILAESPRRAATGAGLSRLWEFKPLRWVLVQAGFAIGLTNLFRFVFCLLVPTTTWGGFR